MPDHAPTPGHLLDGAVSVPDLHVPQGPAPGAPVDEQLVAQLRETYTEDYANPTPQGFTAWLARQFQAAEHRADATRQMANQANDERRQQLLTALGGADDGTTSLAGYITALTDERDQARAERDNANRDLDHARRERDAARAEQDDLRRRLKATSDHANTAYDLRQRLNDAYATIRALTDGTPIPATHVPGPIAGINAAADRVDQALAHVRATRQTLRAVAPVPDAPAPDRQRCPSRIAYRTGAVLRCTLPVGKHEHQSGQDGAVRWEDDDDRVISNGPTLTRCCAHPGCYRTFQADTGPSGLGAGPTPGEEQMVTEHATPVLYLDIDGTVRQGKDDALGRFVNGPEDVHVFPEAVEMMGRWRRAGGRIIGVSNQGGIALGLVTFEQVAAAMLETHRQAHGLFDKIAFCQHHPDAAHPEMSRCWCRKPKPGLVIETSLNLAARRPGEIYPPYMGLMVGDRPEDEQCASLAGLDFQPAVEWRRAAAR
jgi:D-glycero-D-manno-heptose 1,7-bisphosphate phosphatase